METTMLFVALREFTSGLLNQLLVNLAGQDGQVWLEEFKKFLRRESCWVTTEAKKEMEKVKTYLRRLFVDETITVSANDETETFQGAGFVIGYVHSDYKRVVEPRPQMVATIYELVENGTFGQFLAGNPGRWIESQVVKFCHENRDRLRTDGHATFFELEGGFVALVRLYSGGLPSVYVRRFGPGIVWGAECRHRVVIPQQKLKF